jgi:bifunctional DNA-binding transcriptional regulator/antitoxin component of YhaV-PrlF toxin-antitoxin module
MANCCNNGDDCGDEVCRIDAVITMDAKGQFVLPKDLRDKANMKANDKIAVVACEKDGEVCCIMMIKAEKLVGAVTKTLSPLITPITKPETKK